MKNSSNTAPIGSADDDMVRVTPVSYGNCPLNRRSLSVKYTICSTNKGVFVTVGVRLGVKVAVGVYVLVGVRVGVEVNVCVAVCVAVFVGV